MAADHEMRLKEIIAAINSHDIERVLSLFADDFLYEEVAADSTVTRNKDELHARFQNLFSSIPDLKVELTSYFASGNNICVEWISSGTHTGDMPGFPATGKNFSYREVVVIELIGDKLSRFSLYCDLLTVMRQLGLA